MARKTDEIKTRILNEVLSMTELENIEEGEYKIYAHINKTNGKVYIGQTKQKLYKRSRGGKGYQDSPYFWKAIEKYGWDNFEHIVLIDGISLTSANQIEEKLIGVFDFTNRSLGYNLHYGGNNSKQNPEAIEKRRRAMIGRHHSPEARRKISEGHKNPSIETRRKISEALRKRKATEKQKILARERFLGNRYRAKPINQYDLDGNFIKQWGCAKDVENEIGINHSNIGKCCNFNAKTAGGFQWRYSIGEYEKCGKISPMGVHSNQYPVEQYNKQGCYIKTWSSLAEIKHELKTVNTTNIIKCCNNEIKSAYGYIWKYPVYESKKGGT